MKKTFFGAVVNNVVKSDFISNPVIQKEPSVAVSAGLMTKTEMTYHWRYITK